MQLQSQVSREYEGKKYIKSWIVIPQDLLDKLSWKAGQVLQGEVKENKLIIEKEKN